VEELQTGMYRVLAQLQRLQAARAGQSVTTPVMLDLRIDLKDIDAP
jgi:hypothetical protein